MSSAKSKAVLVIRLAVSLGLIGFLFLEVDWAGLISRFQSVDLYWLGLMLIIPHLNILLSAWKWQRLLKALNISADLGRLVAVYFIGTFFSNFLPSMIGGDIVRVLQLSRNRSETSGVVAATFAERFLGLAALVTFVFLILLHGRVTAIFPVIPRLVAVAVVIYALSLVLVFQEKYLVLLKPFRRLRTVDNLLSWVSSAQRKLFEYKKKKGPVIGAYCMSIGFYLLSMCTVYTAGRSLGIHLDAATVLVVVPLVLFVGLLPISIGGLGLNEGSYVFFLTLFGLSSVEAFSIALLLRARILFTGILGGLIFLLHKERATSPAARPNILLLGDYSGNNAGHNALLSALIDELQSAGPCRLLVPSIKPGLLRRLLGPKENVEVIGIAPWHMSLKFLGLPIWRALKKTHCILLTDNLFYDTGLLNLFKNNLLALLVITAYARGHAKPLVYYNSAVGPVQTALGRWCIRRLAERMNLITLRDEQSKAFLDQIAPGVKSIVTADSAFRVSVDGLTEKTLNHRSLWHRFSSGSPLLGVNLSHHLLQPIHGGVEKALSKSEYIKGVAETFRGLSSGEFGDLVFFVTHDKDRAVTKAVARELGTADQITIVNYEEFLARDIAGLASRLSCFIGTRYHELVMCAASGVPLIGINCGEKIAPLLNSLELPHLVMDRDDFVGIDAGDRLARLIDSAISARDVLKSNVRRMREEAAKGVGLLMERGYVPAKAS